MTAKSPVRAWGIQRRGRRDLRGVWRLPSEGEPACCATRAALAVDYAANKENDEEDGAYDGVCGE